MSWTLPSIAHHAGTGSVRLAGRLRVTGPSWVAAVVGRLSGQPPWLPLDPGAPSPVIAAGRHDPAPADVANVHVDAPEHAVVEPVELPDAGYQMDVAPTGVRVRCAEPAGLVQALRALGQLAWPADGGAAVVPAGRYVDAPRFAYRGVHLDVCRHFFDAAFVKRLLRLMAGLGFNVFHWHLTDDQGWRLPVERYPRLTEVGAFRTEADGSRYGGFYSPDEIREIVAFAGSLGILVMPEIELPGHARAAIAAYPQLSCREEPLDVWNHWGICDDVFCAGNDFLFEFVEGVIDEVTRLFPSRFVHLGGDECPRSRWRECDRCAARMSAERLSDYDALQSYVIRRVARTIRQHGRTAVGWDEIREGGAPEDAVVMSWRGTAGGIAAAESGCRVVMTPTSHCYFDYRQLDEPDAPGFSFPDENGRVPVITLPRVYSFDPLHGVSESAAGNVLGGQANVWTETMGNDEAVERMIAPRILAMAEVLWAYPPDRAFSRFRDRVVSALGMLDAMGFRHTDVPELR